MSDPTELELEADEEDDTFPMFAEDLVRQLDRTVPSPELPKTATGWRGVDAEYLQGLAYQAGYRALVDQLMRLVEEQYEPEADSPDGSPLGTSRVLGEGEHVREVQIGVGGMDPVAVRSLLDNGDQ